MYLEKTPKNHSVNHFIDKRILVTTMYKALCWVLRTGKQNDTQLHTAYSLMAKIDQCPVNGLICISNYCKCNKEAIKKLKMESNGKEGVLGTNFS